LQLATSVTDGNNFPLTIQEWLLTTPDYHQSNLFTRVCEISDDTLEVQTTKTNFAIAMKWTRHCLLYIKQVLHLSYIEHAFIESEQESDNIEDWDTPKPPEIQFYSTSRKSNIPKNSLGNTKENTSSHLKIHNETDNMTLATVHTAWSSSQNDISDLHTDYHNQLSLTHDLRMNQLEQLLTNSIQDIQDQYTNIENRLQHVEQSNYYLQVEMNTIMSTLPQLTDKVTVHQALILHTLNDNSEFEN
jgi:hypothetical protein